MVDACGYLLPCLTSCAQGCRIVDGNYRSPLAGQVLAQRAFNETLRWTQFCHVRKMKPALFGEGDADACTAVCSAWAWLECRLGTRRRSFASSVILFWTIHVLYKVNITLVDTTAAGICPMRATWQRSLDAAGAVHPAPMSRRCSHPASARLRLLGYAGLEGVTINGIKPMLKSIDPLPDLTSVRFEAAMGHGDYGCGVRQQFPHEQLARSMMGKWPEIDQTDVTRASRKPSSPSSLI